MVNTMKCLSLLSDSLLNSVHIAFIVPVPNVFHHDTALSPFP